MPVLFSKHIRSSAPPRYQSIFVGGEIAKRPESSSTIPAPIADLLAKHKIVPTAGTKFDVARLDAHLAARSVEIDERMKIKAALRNIGSL